MPFVAAAFDDGVPGLYGFVGIGGAIVQSFRMSLQWPAPMPKLVATWSSQNSGSG